MTTPRAIAERVCIRDEYEEFVAALDQTRQARACISQNHGYDRELAREGYENAVGDTLVPALLKAIDTATSNGDVEARGIERLADLIARWLTKHELITDEGGST